MEQSAYCYIGSTFQDVCVFVHLYFFPLLLLATMLLRLAVCCYWLRKKRIKQTGGVLAKLVVFCVLCLFLHIVSGELYFVFKSSFVYDAIYMTPILNLSSILCISAQVIVVYVFLAWIWLLLFNIHLAVAAGRRMKGL